MILWGDKDEFFRRKIQKESIVKKGNILKVDSFFYHQTDISLFKQMGKEWKNVFLIQYQ